MKSALYSAAPGAERIIHIGVTYFHLYDGDDFKVDCPDGSGKFMGGRD
jgi:hypothetical protein